MLRRILKAWLKWRRNWDALCDRCGRCCYSRYIGANGEIVICYDSPCEHLDTSTQQCRIYEDRFRKCGHCGKVTLFIALFHPTLPKDCAYARTFRLWERSEGSDHEA